MSQVTTQPWFITTHALQRMYEMGLSRSTVVFTVEDPDTDAPSTQDPACRLAWKGDLAVVYKPEGRIVVTVLWHGEAFEREHISVNYTPSSRQVTIKAPPGMGAIIEIRAGSGRKYRYQLREVWSQGGNRPDEWGVVIADRISKEGRVYGEPKYLLPADLRDVRRVIQGQSDN